MARNFNGSTDRIVFSDRSEYDFTGNFTVFCVFKADSGSTNNFSGLVSHANPADATVGFWMTAVWLTNKINLSWNDTDNEVGTIARNTVTRVVGCYDGSNAIVNINGTEYTNARTDNPAASPGDIKIGDEDSAYGHQYHDGDISEVAMWNRALTAGERAALAQGFSPLFFKRGLVFYSPLFGNASPEPNLILGDTGTLSGTTKVDHPRITYPSGGQSIFVPSAPAATVTPLRMLMGMGT